MTLLDKARLLQTSILGGLLFAAAPVYAQDAPGTTGPEVDEILEIADDNDDDFLDSEEDNIIVTGSRLRRDEFTSASPLKVLNIDESIEAGVVDVGTIVQRASVAGGTQFDNTFTGFVTDSGPGSSTIGLRGLDAERTLVLLDGRRLAPSGVRGAPTRPDLNLIPLAILERVDLLTEGASALYGADAVAGVVNFVTRTDFDGVELDLFSSATDAGGGSEFRASVSTGVSNDRGSIGIAAEYYHRDKITRGERDYTPCVSDIEVNPDTGEVRRQCLDGFFGNLVLDATNIILGDVTGDGLGADFNVFGFDYENGGGFTLLPSNDQAGGPGTAIGNRFPYDERYNQNISSDIFDLLQGVDRYSLFSNAQYDLQMLGNAEVYAQALYARREQEIFAGASQIFPSVFCSNPFIQDDPTLSQATACNIPILANFGLDQLIVLPYLEDASGPIFVDVETTRGVVGIRGDLESIIPTGKFQAGGENFGFNLGNWTYDFWASYDRNFGVDRQRAINEERIYQSLNTVVRNPDGSITCGIDALNDDLFGFITPEDCVPFDFTDPQVYLTNRLPADVAAYVAGNATTTTEYQQSVFQGVISGDLAYVPAGTVPFVLGAEFRRDELQTINSFLTTAGAGTGRDEPDTSGFTEYLEVFMETEIPILKGLPLAEELTVTGAARWTEEQFFGALWTYRLQGVYRPTDWITGSVSIGTTFRAPNLREQNLAGQTSFLNAFADPCIVSNLPDAATDPELRQLVINNCQLQGADPFTLGQGAAVTIPVVTGGTRALNAETSDSLYGRVVVEQPWFDSFDLSVAVGYYSIEIEDTVEEPSANRILGNCLVNPDFPGLTSPFCDLIDRSSNLSDPSRNFISRIDATFFNTGLIETDGLDFDIQFEKDFALGGSELTLNSALSASNVMSFRSQQFPEEPFLADDGRPNLPHWSGDLFTQLTFEDFRVNHTVRYIGKTMDDDIDAIRQNDVVDAFTGEVFFPAGFRDVEETDDQFIHDFSAGYAGDTWDVLIGIRNAFDKEPPLVDEGEGYFTSANAVLGGGYDVFGRSFFARLNKRF